MAASEVTRGVPGCSGSPGPRCPALASGTVGSLVEGFLKGSALVSSPGLQARRDPVSEIYRGEKQ